jgi:hypothetical protein
LPPIDPGFVAVRNLIQNARRQALQAVNTELVGLYWQVGEYISRKLASAEWGDGVVDELARYLARTQPGLKGFTRPNLFRMRQLYETYVGDEKVSALLRQLPWTHNLIILSQAKRPEERELYQKMDIDAGELFCVYLHLLASADSCPPELLHSPSYPLRRGMQHH